MGKYSTPTQSEIERYAKTGYRDAPRPLQGWEAMGMCDVCGRAIRHHYFILSQDGNKFVAGSSCVRKTGDAGLTTALKEADKQQKREAREAEYAQRAREARLERERLDKEERAVYGGFTLLEHQEKFRSKAREDLADLVEPFIRYLFRLKGDFVRNMAELLAKEVLPSGRAAQVTKEILAKKAGRKNSKAYKKEYERVSQIWDDAILLERDSRMDLNRVKYLLSKESVR
jgi:hypothetical protein